MQIRILRWLIGTAIVIGSLTGTRAVPAFEQTFVNRPPALINRDDLPTSETDSRFNPRQSFGR
jgi:hypothetical protein